MALTVYTNVSSLNAQRNLNTSQSSLNTSLQRLSSGLRINSAKDDAAGLAISERFTAQIRGNEQASRNANDGISLSQTAEGALAEIGNNLQRMRELAVQASNATNSDSDRAAINNEVQALSTEIDRVAQNSAFNGTKLLDGSFTAKNFQVGANNAASDSIQITAISSARTSALGGVSGANYAGVDGTATTAALNAGDVTLNGIQVGASTAGGAAGQTAASAYSIAAAINAVSGQSGVTASAQATSIAGVAPAASGAIAANAFSINGVNVGAVAAGGDAVGQGANVAASINAISSQTGVIASANATTGAVTLAAADGRDITIGGTVTNTGLTAATTHGTVKLEAATDIVVSGGAVASAGLTAATTTATPGAAVSTVATMNVLTATNALKALDTIDGALASINNSRAALGAYQNRFASVVANQQTTVENLSASRGRIQDADFAKETANLSRAQVLQQAGTAMLSQANQSTQGVLSLLR
ncbi:MAG: flagellin [Methylobacter sp.]|uniref:flagellin N-terminal helical domain-containing protein n=1 Tax=Methylobacter sp. TaxID=2051955 RepID=UPI0025E196AC|nr:flagellin [Methylobacter sp.]MCK9623021.1 flagellin [Methylobacter sp.]